MYVVPLLKKDIRFPAILTDDTLEDDVIAIGGDTSTARLLEAYTHGIFPWPARESELLWVSTNPRFVLFPENLHLPKSLKRTLKKKPYTFTVDTCFERVIRECSAIERPGQEGTWITRSIIQGYIDFHQAGYAHSIEAWADGELVGGFYGVAIGHIFCGESMFARRPDASKCAFATFAPLLFEHGIDLIDCQDYTENLARFGATEIPRAHYLQHLARALREGTDSCISWSTFALGEVGKT